MPLPTLPTPPSRDDPANFSARADAFLAALPAFGDGANALEQSLQMVATTGTSTTSLAIGTGSKTLTTQAGKAWVVGAFVYIASSASVANLMFGQITAYNSTTGSLTVNVLSYTGSGTLAAWSIGLSAPRGGTETFSGTVYASRFEIDSLALYVSGGAAILNFDPSDFLRYTRGTDVFDVVIGGTSRLAVSAAGPERSDDASSANGLVRKSQAESIASTAATSAASAVEAKVPGISQTWQNVTASRVAGTTYYNATARPIFVAVSAATASGDSSVSITVSGSVVVNQVVRGPYAQGAAASVMVPPGAGYSASATASISTWFELR